MLVARLAWLRDLVDQGCKKALLKMSALFSKGGDWRFPVQGRDGTQTNPLMGMLDLAHFSV